LQASRPLPLQGLRQGAARLPQPHEASLQAHPSHFPGGCREADLRGRADPYSGNRVEGSAVCNISAVSAAPGPHTLGARLGPQDREEGAGRGASRGRGSSGGGAAGARGGLRDGVRR